MTYYAIITLCALYLFAHRSFRYPLYTSFLIIIFSKICLILVDPSTHPPNSLKYLEMSRVDSLGMTVG